MTPTALSPLYINHSRIDTSATTHDSLTDKSAFMAVDTAYVANYCGIPQSNVDTLVAEPSPDLVTTFLRTIITRAQEHEALKTERLRADVELENAVRGGEARARTLKANADKALQEVESLRKKLDEEGELRQEDLA